MKNYISHSPEQTEQIAAEFASTLKSGDVIAYKGPMGAGKTAFTRRSWVNGGNQNQLAVRLAFQSFGKVVRKLCLIVTVWFQLLRTDTERTGYFGDGLHSTLLGDFDVCKHG